MNINSKYALYHNATLPFPSQKKRDELRERKG